MELLTDHDRQRFDLLVLRLKTLATEIHRFNNASSLEHAHQQDNWRQLGVLLERHQLLKQTTALFEDAARSAEYDELLLSTGHPVIDAASRLDLKTLREIVAIVRKLDADHPVEGYLAAST